MKEQAIQEVLPYSGNRCKDIYELGNNLLPILEKYISNQKKKDTEETDMPIPVPMSVKQSIYIPIKMVSSIHEVCNNQQFEDISETDFYANLNLQPYGSKLKIRPREKARVCYLIFLIRDHPSC